MREEVAPRERGGGGPSACHRVGVSGVEETRSSHPMGEEVAPKERGGGGPSTCHRALGETWQKQGAWDWGCTNDAGRRWCLLEEKINGPKRSFHDLRACGEGIG